MVQNFKDVYGATVQQVRATMHIGRGALEGLESIAADIQARVQKVQEGVGKIQEGKALIEEGVTGDKGGKE